MDTKVADPLIGALVDERYRVRARVARGGMATVYTAVDERLERVVALKIIHPSHASEPRFLDRFTDEAKAIARLTHPNVVAVYDQGTYQGLPYLVMEYVRGRTLRDLLAQRHRLTPPEALAVLEQMLAAVAAAHRAGLVHRDVKPENVLVAEAPGGSLLDSVVKVADFGLARAVEACADDGGGHLLATVAYVAPELVSDGHADPRTDVYSAGVVLFEMLTGQVPYEAERPIDVAWQHVDRVVPPPSEFVPGLPQSIDDLVVRATRRDPGGRPTDAGAMLAEVQDARDDVGAGAAARSRPEPRTTMLPPIGPSMLDQDVTAAMPSIAERPAWARLPQAPPRRGPQPYPQAPPRPYPRQYQSGSTPTGLAGLKAKLLGDPKGRVAVAASLVVLGLLVAIGGWWFGVGRFTTAPTLVAQQKAQAEAAARQAGFTVRYDAGRYDEKAPKDAVLAQNPPAGQRIVSGGTITLTLSLGPERNPVPDVVGMDFELAQNELTKVKMVPKRVETFDDVVPVGSVVATDPAPGTRLAPNAPVVVKVSKGRAPITVPTLVGKSLDDAQSQLRGLGLKVSIKQQDSDRPKDQVIAQDPADGTGLERGATVTVTVSNGPAAVEVPDLTGQEADQARTALTQLGLNADVIGFGRVRTQNPAPGTRVPPDTRVVLFCI